MHVSCLPFAEVTHPRSWGDQERLRTHENPSFWRVKLFQFGASREAANRCKKYFLNGGLMGMIRVR